MSVSGGGVTWRLYGGDLPACEVASVPFALLLTALAEVPDPRRAQGQRYSMSHLLLFSVLAVLTGATSYKKIVAFVALQRERLNAAFGACFRRAPAVNTLRHLFLALGRDDLEAAFRRHARDLSAGDTAGMPRTVALDGKTLRGSFDHLTDRKAVHVLSAFASDAALILAHQELAGAPDEIAAVPKLMAELGLTGVLFNFAAEPSRRSTHGWRTRARPTFMACDGLHGRCGRTWTRSATPSWSPGVMDRWKGRSTD